jgi:hypothetical protein
LSVVALSEHERELWVRGLGFLVEDIQVASYRYFHELYATVKIFYLCLHTKTKFSLFLSRFHFNCFVIFF